MSSDLARFIARRFIARTDVKAQQLPGGAYVPLRSEPWTVEDIDRHLDGGITYGHYMLDEENRCKLIVFDLDMGKGIINPADKKKRLPYRFMIDGVEVEMFPQDVLGGPDSPERQHCIKLLRTAAAGIASIAERTVDGAKVMTSYSGGKGLHVYVLFPSIVEARQARIVAQGIMGRLDSQWTQLRGDNFLHSPGSFPGVEVELFPKQDTTEDLGNLVRLPCGLHQKSGNQGFFLDSDAPIEELRPLDPAKAIT